MKRLILLLVIIFLSGKTTFTQCDGRLRPDDNSMIAYKQRDNRCEGYYIAKVGAPSLQVVGFQKGRLKYDYDNKHEIILVRSTLGDKTINIRAIGVPLNTYYQMDAQIKPSETFKWPIADVIYPNRLNSGSIKIFGWVGTENDKTYVPVIPDSRSITNTDDNVITLFIRASTDVTKVIWRQSAFSNGSCGKYGKNKEIEKSYRSGKAIPIPLENLAGTVCIEIKARKKNSSHWPRKEIRVLINEE